MERLKTVKHLARRQPLWQAQGAADQGAHGSSRCPGKYRARPSECIVDGGKENKRRSLSHPIKGWEGPSTWRLQCERELNLRAGVERALVGGVFLSSFDVCFVYVRQFFGASAFVPGIRDAIP